MLNKTHKFPLYTSFDFVPPPFQQPKNSIAQSVATLDPWENQALGLPQHHLPFPPSWWLHRCTNREERFLDQGDSSPPDWKCCWLVISTNACALHTLRSTLSIDASISLIEQSGPRILAESCLSLIVVTITNIIFNPVTYCSFRRYPLLGSASFGLKAVWCRHHQQGRSRWHCNPHIRCSISDQNRRAQ